VFTGITEEIGTVSSLSRRADGFLIKIHAEKIVAGLRAGNSVSVNGVCLTVTAIGKNYFSADVVNETMQRSTLKNLKAQTKVNLERAMRADERFGGHIVSGHVDTVGRVVKVVRRGTSADVVVSCDKSYIRYIVEKGSVAVDGVSLTVSKMSNTSFSVALIPYTLASTAFRDIRVGDEVNIEVDVLGKYAEKMAYSAGRPSSHVDEEFLKEIGFLK
jgi:riboflavin synthase